MVVETMGLYDGTQWSSVCGEEEGSKNWPLRNPGDQLMCFGYLPSPGHLERPTSEIGFKPAKLNPSNSIFERWGYLSLLERSGEDACEEEDTVLSVNEYTPLSNVTY